MSKTILVFTELPWCSCQKLCNCACMIYWYVLLPGGSVGKEAACSAGDTGSFPGMGRKCNTLQNSCLENPMDREAWRAAVHGSQRVRHNWSDLAHIHTSQFYSTDLYVCLYARTICFLDYCTFVVCFNIKKNDFSNFCLDWFTFSESCIFNEF